MYQEIPTKELKAQSHPRERKFVLEMEVLHNLDFS